MYDQITLPSGLRIIGERIDHVRSCSLGCFVGVGSRNETAEENGFSHFIEHMVFKGTATRTARQIAEEMDLAGANINAYTSKECTCFYSKVTDDQLELGVDMISDLVLHPTFDPVELDKERGVVLEEIAMCEDDPDDVAMDLLSKTEFSGSLSMPISGPAKNIRECTREDLLSYWRRHYHAENMVLSISGHYDWNAFLALVEKYMKDFPNEKPESLPKSEQQYFSAVAVKSKDVEQLHIALSYPGVPAFSPDSCAVSMLCSILGGNMSSRLFQKIREEMGMAYQIGAFSDSYRKIGTLVINTGTSPENAQTVLNEIHHQIEIFLKDGITEKEFICAKAQIRVGYLFSLENCDRRMQHMGNSLLMNGYVKSVEEMISLIDSVTPEKIMELAGRLLCQPGCGVIVGRDAEQYLPLLLGKEST